MYISTSQRKNTDNKYIYEKVCRSKIKYGTEVWGLSKELDNVHSRFFKKLMRIKIVQLVDLLKWNLAERVTEGSVWDRY
jgi:hypothetical protein